MWPFDKCRELFEKRTAWEMSARRSLMGLKGMDGVLDKEESKEFSPNHLCYEQSKVVLVCVQGNEYTQELSRKQREKLYE